MVEHLKDYPTMNSIPGNFHMQMSLHLKKKKMFITFSKTSYAVKQSTKHFFVKIMFTSIPKKPFLWTRGYQVGGRSLMWGRWLIEEVIWNLSQMQKME